MRKVSILLEHDLMKWYEGHELIEDFPARRWCFGRVRTKYRVSDTDPT
jgi:hypothetical protein